MVNACKDYLKRTLPGQLVVPKIRRIRIYANREKTRRIAKAETA